MKNIAIITDICHKKTKSFDFLKNIIEKELKSYYYYNNKSYLYKKYDYYIFLQIVPDFFDLLKIKNENIIFVPMYDSSILNKYAWEYYKGFKIKIICFSKILYDFLNNEGFNCIYTQYFLSPLNYNIPKGNKKIFFWYRGSILWEQVKKILGNQKVEITIKNYPDPQYKKLELTENEIKKYNITFINKFFKTHEEHYKFLANHNIFIAPREKEGIGMSFLESMSLGQCVIGYNQATMNEYIKNGKNGILTNFKSEIILDNFEQIGGYCKEKYIKSYELWNLNKYKIANFIKGKYTSNSKIKISHYIIIILLKIRRIILRLK